MKNEESDMQDRYEYLASRWKNRTITRTEEKELLDWLNNGEGDLLNVPVSFAKSEEELRSKVYKEINEALKLEKPVRGVRLWPKFAGIAAALAAVTVGVWLYFESDDAHSPRLSQKSVSINQVHDIAPAKNTALLTIDNGKTIELSDTEKGVVIDARKFTYADGSPVALTLENGTSFSKAGTARNINISTPRGGTYQVVLPDGTKVWLNAASTIKFPFSFEGAKQRIVELTGEAYFAVRKSPDVPFVVKSRGQEARVLGTEFNISSYPDEEKVRTTLVEGSLRVTADPDKSFLLEPGKETVLTAGELKESTADVEMATAWRTGAFYFNKTSFAVMMRQVSRWYNVDVVYLTKKIPDIRFTGEIKRDVMLQTLLIYIEDLGVQVRLEGRTLYIQ
jgi:transmembrane sensor